MLSLKKTFGTSSLLLAALLLVVSLMIPGINASAATDKGSAATESNDLLLNLPESVDFDLTKGEKQEFVYIDENGDEVVYGAEPVVDEMSTMGTSKIGLGNTTWKIYWYNGAVNMSYYIDVNRTSSSTKITNAYDLSVTMVGYTESNRSFGFTSTKAEYSATAVLFNFAGSIGVRLTATVSGDTLTTTVKA